MFLIAQQSDDKSLNPIMSSTDFAEHYCGHFSEILMPSRIGAIPAGC